MPHENVELVRAFYLAVDAALTADDPLAHLAQFLDPQVEFINAPDAVDPGVRRGHAGILEVARSLRDSFEQVTVEVGEVRDAGGRVVASATFRATGKASGAEMRLYVAQVFTLAGGRIVRIEDFNDRARALEAAGLSPE